MAHAREGLDSSDLLFAQVDFRLMPKLDPVAPQGLAEVDLRRRAGGFFRIPDRQNLAVRHTLKRFLQEGQHRR